MAEQTPMERILAWERAYLSYPVGTRAIYLDSLRDYYNGAHLQKKSASSNRGQMMRRYPLAVNYGRQIVDKLNALIWGQFLTSPTKQIVTWEVPPVKEEWGGKTWTPRADAIKDLLNHVFFTANHGNDLLYRWSLDSGIYGTSVISPRYDIMTGEILLDIIPTRNFHCIWRSDNSIVEALVSEQITRQEAKEQYGWNPSLTQTVGNILTGSEMIAVQRHTHWTPYQVSIYIENSLIKVLPNPYSWVELDTSSPLQAGIIPFIVLPNRPVSGDFYGYSDMDSIIDIQDELNFTLAMMGDIVSENAHPQKVLKNVRTDDDRLSDRILKIFDAGGRDAEAKLLTYEGGMSTAQQYVDDLMQSLEDTSGVPAVAFGRYKGTQGSSLMLQVELKPALDLAVWKRLLIGASLAKAAEMIVKIAITPISAGVSRKINGKTLTMTAADAMKHRIQPSFAAMLPKDDVANANKQIALLGVKLRSKKRCLEDLDEPNIEEELKNIEADADDEMNRQQKSLQKSTDIKMKAEQMQSGEDAVLSENQKEARGTYVGGK